MPNLLKTIIIGLTLSLTNVSIGDCQPEYYIVDRGSNFKVLYLESIITDFELENIIRDTLEDKTQFNPSEREYTIDVYIEKEYWMTVRYSIQTGLKIIRRN